jgi:hypothetical protein
MREGALMTLADGPGVSRVRPGCAWSRSRGLNLVVTPKMAAAFRIQGQKAPAWPIGLTSGSPALKIEKPGGSAGFFVDRIAPSFNGRTAASGAAYRGSNPWGATKTYFLGLPRSVPESLTATKKAA